MLSSNPSNKVIDFGDDVLAENDVSNRRSLRSKGATAPNYTYMMTMMAFIMMMMTMTAIKIGIVVPCLMTTMMILLLLVAIVSHQPGERVQEGELALDGHQSQILKGCLLKQLLKPLQHGSLTEKKRDRNHRLAAASSFAELDGTSVDSSTYTGVLDPQL